MEYNTDHFLSMLAKMNISLSDKQLQQFMTYYEMLIEKNKVMNLTAITDFDEVVEKHFVDRVSLVQVGDLHQPLKVVFPELNVVLADSLNKRLVFLNEVIDALGLTEIYTVHGRAEDLARMPEYREQFDLCVSRAVANLSTLAEYCLPFVRLGGKFISYKSGECENEVAAAKSAIFLLGGKVEDFYWRGAAGIHFFNKGKRYIKKISKKSRNALQKSFVIYAFFHCFERKKDVIHIYGRVIKNGLYL